MNEDALLGNSVGFAKLLSPDLKIPLCSGIVIVFIVSLFCVKKSLYVYIGYVQTCYISKAVVVVYLRQGVSFSRVSVTSYDF